MVQTHVLPPLARTASRIDSSAIRDLLHVTERPDVISLAGGLPAPETFPVEELRAATDAVLARDGSDALQYSTTEGFAPLREWLAGRNGCDPTDVTITSGSQQGLDLAARTLVEPGAVVAMADPGYVGAIQAFRLAGADLVGIPSDDDGMRVDVLADLLADGLRPSVVYVVANFSNPTGVTLADDRRDALAELAERYGFWIVEDDPYAALRWAGEHVAPMAARTANVVSLGTFSKVVCPGLRVAHVVAPPTVTATFVLLKQAVDLHASTLSQRVVHELVSTPGFFDAHVASLPDRYRPRAVALTDALRRHLGERASFRQPEGGMFVWVDLGPGVDTSMVLPAAVDAGVAFVPGAAFAVTRHLATSLRLSFATASPAEIDEAVRRLASVL